MKTMTNSELRALRAKASLIKPRAWSTDQMLQWMLTHKGWH